MCSSKIRLFETGKSALLRICLLRNNMNRAKHLLGESPHVFQIRIPRRSRSPIDEVPDQKGTIPRWITSYECDSLNCLLVDEPPHELLPLKLIGNWRQWNSWLVSPYCSQECKIGGITYVNETSINRKGEKSVPC